MAHTHPGSLAAPVSLTAALATALAPHTTHAFGLMGNGNAHFIDQLRNHQIELTEVRHETATVAAADAYTRITGKLALATTTYGAGFTNALTALAEAAQARTPVIVVVGDAPTTGPRPWDVDQEMLAAALGVRTYTLTQEDPHEIVDRAVSSAIRNRRPVIIAIPYDLASATVQQLTPALTPTVQSETEQIDLDDPAVIASLVSATKHASLSVPTLTPGRTGTTALQERRGTAFATDPRIAAAAAALRDAHAPVIIAGRGAVLAGAQDQLAELASLAEALTATTALARGVFPEARYDLGITGGFGQELAMERIATADTVVVVGARLNQFTMRFGELFGPDTHVIRIDTEDVASPVTAHPISHEVVLGDAAHILEALNTHLRDTPRPRTQWRETIAGLESGGALRVREGSTDANQSLCSDGLLDPRSVALRIADSLPEDRHVTSDGGHFIGWANMYWPVASPERMIMVGTAYQTIGLGFSTVAGVAAAAPGSTVVLSTGDGGGLMSLADLETTIRTTQSCVVVVWNDGAYGAEVHLYGRMGLDESPMRIPDVNFAGVASALGANGVSVRSLADLDALDEWREAGATGTIVLDCHVSRSIIAPYQFEVLKANGVK